jgi:hypothetical protein
MPRFDARHKLRQHPKPLSKFLSKLREIIQPYPVNNDTTKNQSLRNMPTAKKPAAKKTTAKKPAAKRGSGKRELIGTGADKCAATARRQFKESDDVG